MNLKQPLLHPRALAYLGDSVYELWVREVAVQESQKTDTLHRYTTARVKAETQVKILAELEPTLPEEALQLLKRAQNMPVTTNRRSNQAIHRKATAFEALIGYWFTQEPEQLEQHRQRVLQILSNIFDSQSQI